MSLGKLSIDLSNYELGKEIGKGTFGTVYKSKDLRTGEDVAIKVINQILVTKKDQEVFLREIVIPGRIKSSGIVNMIGFRFPISSDEKKDEKGINNAVIVTEYIPNGSLKEINAKYLSSSDVLPNFGPTERAIIIFGVAAIMMKAHEAKIIHRDLTLGNVMLDENMFPKVGDFGCARFANNDTNKTLIVGTPISMAPEIMESEDYDQSIDVYSYGILLYLMFTNEIELDDGLPIRSTMNMMLRVQNGVRPKRPPNMPDFYWELATSCWSHAPKDRPTFSQIVHKFLENDKMLLDEKGKKTDLLKLHHYQNMMMDESSVSHSDPNPAKEFHDTTTKPLTHSGKAFRKQKFNWHRH